MLAIGRALVADPEMILLDEPSLGLAPLIVKDIFEIIARINREKKVSMLLVEQNAVIALDTHPTATSSRTAHGARRHDSRSLGEPGHSEILSRRRDALSGCRRRKPRASKNALRRPFL